MRTVWKYFVALNDIPTPHQVPLEARFVRAEMVMQTGIWLWAEVNPNATKVRVDFSIIGTGHEVPDGTWWTGTVMDTPFVWHVYRNHQLSEPVID